MDNTILKKLADREPLTNEEVETILFERCTETRCGCNFHCPMLEDVVVKKGSNCPYLRERKYHNWCIVLSIKWTSKTSSSKMDLIDPERRI